MKEGDIATREANATAIRRAKKAAKAASAGKAKKQVDLRFSLAKEDRYVRPVASLASVSEMLEIRNEYTDGLPGPRWSFYAAKPVQSHNGPTQYLDTLPLYIREEQDEKWVSRYWPSLLEVCNLMELGDIQHLDRDIQVSDNPTVRTTLYIKRVI